MHGKVNPTRCLTKGGCWKCVVFGTPLFDGKRPAALRAMETACTACQQPGVLLDQVSASYLVDPASSHMLVSKIKPCMCKYKPVHGETANGSLNQLWFLRSLPRAVG